MESKTLHILYSGLGGTTNYVANWVKAAGNSMQIDCLFYGIEDLNSKTRAQFENLGVHVYFVKKKSRIDFKGHRQIKTILKKGYENVILHIDSLIIPVAKHKPANTKLIAVEHQANHLKDKRRWLWSKLSQKKADAIISLTESYQLELKKKLNNFFPSKNHIIKTGIDIEHYNTPSDRQEKLYGAVGRLNGQRDFETLIYAFNDLDNSYQLEIAGIGEEMERLMNLANENIKFLGELKDQEMVKFLNRISVFLKPSFGETSSPAIMEAQAAGLPVIAWKVNGITNVLNDENSILVAPKDKHALKNAVVRLSGENEQSLREIQRLSKASMKYAEDNLSHVDMFNSYKALMK